MGRLVLVALSWAAIAAGSLHAQSVEDRVRLLEQQVAELRRLAGLPADTRDPIALPAELIGNEHTPWGFPGGGCLLLVKEHYVVCHDNGTRVATWVTYHSTRENLAGDAERRDNFRADAELAPGERSELEDYRNSGYDRGHLAPAADFQRSAAAMSETFLLSNMAPQRPNLNRQRWALLEAQVRDVTLAHGSTWIFTGPLYLDVAGAPTTSWTTIGSNQVAIPTHFFKVILCEHTTGTVELFAFIMPNSLEPLPGSPRDYLVSVDRVERLAGLNLFSALPDTLEDRLEALVATAWPIE